MMKSYLLEHDYNFPLFVGSATFQDLVRRSLTFFYLEILKNSININQLLYNSKGEISTLVTACNKNRKWHTIYQVIQYIIKTRNWWKTSYF
jgi:hypothetical protein